MGEKKRDGPQPISSRALGRLLQSGLGLADHGAEPGRVSDRKLGQDLTIQGDPGLLDPEDQATVV